MSYFHTGIRTIIGAEAFHCPVRDGKEWDHLAMVIRLDRSPPCFQSKAANSQSQNQIFDCESVLDLKSDTTTCTHLDHQVKVIGSSLTSN